MKYRNTSPFKCPNCSKNIKYVTGTKDNFQGYCDSHGWINGMKIEMP